MAVASIIFDLIGRDRASDPINRVGNSAEKSGGKLAKFGKLAKMAAVGLAAGVGAAAVGLFKLTQGAAEDAAGQARLARALQNTTGATRRQIAGVEDWISKQGVALGVADDQLRPALEKLALATGDVGKAQKLASLAMDVSAGTGMSLEAVSKALAKAQNGQVAGLSKLGIKTKDAEGKVISFREATRRLATAHKGQAATAANTFQGKMERLKLILAETGESIGAKVLPYVTKMADWFLRKGLPALEQFGGYLSTVLPPIFSKVKAVVSAVTGALHGDVSKNVGGIKEIFRNAVSIVQTIWRTFGSTIVSYLRASFENARIILQGAFTVIRGIFQTVSALLKGDWKGVWDGVKTILRGAVTLIKGLVRQMWNVIKTVFRIGGTLIKNMVRTTMSGTVALFRAGSQKIVEGIRALPGRLIAVAGTMLNAGKTLGGKLIQGLKRGITGIPAVVGSIATAAFDKLKGLINSAIDTINSHIPNSLGKGPISIDLPDNPIPRLARGGPVKKGHPYIVGDRGPRHAWELFVPNEDGRVHARVPNADRSPVRARGGTRGGGVTIINKVVIQAGVGDPVAIAKQVERVLVVGQRSLGRAYHFTTAGSPG